MLGPIDYIVVEFAGSTFDGTILTELQKATDSGAIRLVDLVFVMKDAAGTVNMAELEGKQEELKGVLNILGHTDDLPMLSQEDLQALGASMKENTSAGILVVEQLWAKGLKRALLNNGAVVVDEGRIHPEATPAQT